METIRFVRSDLIRWVLLGLLLGSSLTVIGEESIPGLTKRGERELAKHPIPDFTAGDKKGETNDWNLGPADGMIRGLDILAVVNQFYHDCVAPP